MNQSAVNFLINYPYCITIPRKRLVELVTKSENIEIEGNGVVHINALSGKTRINNMPCAWCVVNGAYWNGDYYVLFKTEEDLLTFRLMI